MTATPVLSALRSAPVEQRIEEEFQRFYGEALPPVLLKALAGLATQVVLDLDEGSADAG